MMPRWSFAVALGAYIPTAQAQGAAMPVTGVGQMLFGLAVVIGLVFAVAWIARRLGVSGQDASPLLRRVAALPVGPRERIMIVEAGNDWLVVGVTSQSIQTLHTMPKGEIPEGPAHKITSGLAGGFAALLQKARTGHAPQ